MRVKCLAQEHNTMSPARARTQTTQCGDKRTSHEATAPLSCLEIVSLSLEMNPPYIVASFLIAYYHTSCACNGAVRYV